MLRFYFGLSILFLSYNTLVSQEKGKLFSAFEKLDKNGDGLVSKEEASISDQPLRWIDDADEDGNGLSLKEARSWFAENGRVALSGTEEKRVEIIGDFPEDGPVSAASCRDAAEYSAGANGLSTLIQVGETIVFEAYEEGHSPETAHRLASGTKSFSGALLALAVKDGLLELDEPVSKTITEWQGDSSLSRITIRQLLNLTSGINPGDNGNVPTYGEAIKAESVSLPGESFAYGPAPFQIFGELLTRKLLASDELSFGDPLEYMKDRVFDPIGFRYEFWRRDRDGKPHLPSGAFLTAREWVKYGELLIHDGVWKGTAILDKDTLQECRVGSSANGTYGLTFWLLDPNPDSEVPAWRRGGYMAAGAGKQRLYVLPAVGVLAVRQGEGGAYEDDEFLERLFKDQ